MEHRIYSTIVRAINDGRLKEPFSTHDFRRSCPNLGEGTYQAFLYKHKVGNKKGLSVLFEQVGVNRFILVRPLKYNL